MNQSQLNLNLPLLEESPSSLRMRAKRAHELQMDQQALLERAWRKAIDYEITDHPSDKPNREEAELVTKFLQ